MSRKFTAVLNRGTTKRDLDRTLSTLKGILCTIEDEVPTDPSPTTASHKLVRPSPETPRHVKKETSAVPTPTRNGERGSTSLTQSFNHGVGRILDTISARDVHIVRFEIEDEAVLTAVKQLVHVEFVQEDGVSEDEGGKTETPKWAQKGHKKPGPKPGSKRKRKDDDQNIEAAESKPSKKGKKRKANYGHEPLVRNERSEAEIPYIASAVQQIRGKEGRQSQVQERAKKYVKDMVKKGWAGTAEKDAQSIEKDLEKLAEYAPDPHSTRSERRRKKREEKERRKQAEAAAKLAEQES